MNVFDLDSKNSRVITAILMIAAVLWAFLGFLFGYPYALVPSEDLRYIMQPFEWLHQPLFTFALESAKMVGTFLEVPRTASLLLLSLFSLGASGLLVGWFTWRLTADKVYSVGASLLFLTSGWTLHYLLYGNYTVWATFLFLLIAFCLSRAAEFFNHQRASEAKTGYPSVSPELIYVLFSGILAGFLFLSSPSSPVMLALLTAYLWFAFRKLPAKNRLAVMGYFFVPFLLVILPYAARMIPELVEHWRMNVFDNNLKITKKDWGYELPYIAGIFWRMGALFSPLIVASWTLVMAILGVLFFVKHSFLKKNALTPWIFLGLLHVLLIEILPSTKLSRTHFAAWPLVILGLAVGLHVLSKSMAISAERWVKAVFVLLVIGSAVQGASLIRQAEYQKMEAVRLLQPVLANTQLYVLAQDPHATVIQAWLGRQLPVISKISEVKHEAGKRVGVIIGPHGPGSGYSGLRASLLRDFYPQNIGVFRPKGATEQRLPFHAYFPTYLMEEEVSQALYFLGRSPDYRTDDLKLTLWTWE